jgi:NAD+ synthase
MIDASKAIDHIVNWLKKYCDSAGMRGFVVGISGGIDSALTSTLCARTGLPLIVLNLPINQRRAHSDLSAQHIAWLESRFDNVSGMTIALTSIFQTLENALPEDIQDDLTMANTQSRLRMVALYAVANHHRLLVTGTGNKVEDFGVGFFTKYGDGGVDLSPIADLMKSEVYALANAMGISKGIIQAPPTDGLWDDNRTDESQIGASYAELEWAMGIDAHSKNKESLTPRQKEVLGIYRKMHRANQHKMVPVPVCTIPGTLRK